MTSRKLQIFRFVLIEMFSPYFLNSLASSLLFRSDCGPLGPFTKPGSDSGSDSGSDRTPDRIESDWYLRLRCRIIIWRKAVLTVTQVA